MLCREGGPGVFEGFDGRCLILKHFLFKYRQTVFALGIVLSLVMVFQNCAEPLELSDTDASTFADNLPFAYDVKMDTFAYMSCNTEISNYEPRAIFTFRVGAYEDGSGLRLNDEFVESTKNYTEQARAESLFRSPTNSGAILQLAIRNSSVDYQQILLNASGAVQLGKDVENYLNSSTLDSPGIATPLLNLEEGKRLRYFSGTPGLDGRFLEQSLRFNTVLKSVTEKMVGSTGSRVTLAYTQDNNPLNYFVRGPDRNNLQRVIYGQEFRPTFAPPVRISNRASIATAQDRNRILQSLGVVDIAQKNTRAETMWSCPPEYRYVVIRPEDAKANASLCPLDSWSFDNPPQGRERELEVLRRVIRVEDYYVNMQRRCIVPRDDANHCYPSDSTGINIKYDGTTCNDDPENDIYECPNFVSVCVAPQTGG